MNPPRHTEPQVNGGLARALRRRHPLWNGNTVHAEQTRVLQAAGHQPDILVEMPRLPPVVVETEFHPALTVEREAEERLGASVRSTGMPIESAVAVVIPPRLRETVDDLDAAIDVATDLRYATYHQMPDGATKRWPESEWIKTDVNGLADAIEHLTLSERSLAAGVHVLQRVVAQSAALLGDLAGENALRDIAKNLHQEGGEQTQRMASAIWVVGLRVSLCNRGTAGDTRTPAQSNAQECAGYVVSDSGRQLLADL